jgi:hypothetical protein
MDEWAKSGPIDARNYDQRAEHHCSIKSKERGGTHPTINRNSAEFLRWQEYFDRWLRGRPLAFQRLLDFDGVGDGPEMTVPESLPQWFDPSFLPTKNWRPAAPIEARPSRFALHNRANVFVPIDDPRYPQMLERSKTADPLDWRLDDERPGIWVGFFWLDNTAAAQQAKKASWKPFTAEELRKLYPSKKPNDAA